MTDVGPRPPGFPDQPRPDSAAAYPAPWGSSPSAPPYPPSDGTVLRPRGPAPQDGSLPATYGAPAQPSHPPGWLPGQPGALPPTAAGPGGYGGPLAPAPVPTEGTVLRPYGPAPLPADGTVLRPSGPPAQTPPGGGVPSDGTVLRPRGPVPPAADRPGAGSSGTGPGSWGTTPPTQQPGGWTPPPAAPTRGWYDTGAEQTVYAPHLQVPQAVAGPPQLGESRFAPPEERPGVPDALPPQERFAPLPIPGGPTDLPHGGRYAAPEADESTPSERAPRRVSRWVVALVGLLVIGLAAAGLWWRFYRPVVVDPAITVPTSAAPVNKPKVDKPEDAVKGYLEALRAGDITQALSYGPVGPGSQVLLTPNAVKDSQARAPIGNIVVPATTGATSSVKARYTIGTEAVERTFNVVKTDDGGWQLAKATTTVQLTPKRSTRVPLIVNKQAVENVAVLELVPGVYHFETGLPFLRYAATTDLKVLSLDYNEPIQVLSLELTDEGRAALLSQAQASMQKCLDQGSLNPPNCPFGYAQPKPVTSIKWTQKKDPWTGIQFTLTKEDPAVAEANFTISLNANVEFADGQKSPNNTYEGEVRLTADVTKQRVLDIQVKWSEAVR